MNKNKFLEVFKEYEHHFHGHGVFDCNLMVLEATGYDTSTIEPYSTAMEGLRSLRATGYRRMGEYLLAIGYTKINPVFISDFDIVVQGASCAIYLDGRLFMLDENKRFEFIKINKEYFNNNKIEVYQYGY